MVVLVRRMKRPEYDDEYWEDDVESDEDEGPQTSEQIMYASETTRTLSQSLNQSKKKRGTLGQNYQKAQETGVMQAAPGTEQGKTGWYVDSTGELTSWIVGEDGIWTRMS